MDSECAVGCRVLVVEDEIFLATMIEEILQDLGCIVIGPVAKLDRAMQLARHGAFDMAVLDVNIRGGKIFPAAELLLARGIPFLLASGYGDWALPPSLRGQPRLTKPFSSQEIEDQVRQLCRGRASRAAT